MFHGSEQKALVYLGAEDAFAELKFSDNLILQILDFQFWHGDVPT
jgi:hypothetical protein